MEFKRIKENINDLEWNDRSDLLTENGKELLKELKLALSICEVSRTFKEKDIPNFEAWKELRYKRVNSEILECKGTHLWFEFREVYEKYKKEFNIEP